MFLRPYSSNFVRWFFPLHEHQNAETVPESATDNWLFPPIEFLFQGERLLVNITPSFSKVFVYTRPRDLMQFIKDNTPFSKPYCVWTDKKCSIFFIDMTISLCSWQYKDLW